VEWFGGCYRKPQTKGALKMCQATIYLDGKEIMQDVTLVEPVPEGIRLKTFFEPPIVVPAVIRQIDLLKHRVILETIQKGEHDHERSGETAGVNPPLDGAQRRTRQRVPPLGQAGG